MREGSLTLLLATTALSAIIVFAIRYLLEYRKKHSQLDIERKSSLLSDDEKLFYNVLKQTVSDQCTVFSKVRLLDLVDINGHIVTRAQGEQFRRISRRVLDFLVCSPITLKPVIGIVLDHRQSRLRRRNPYPDDMTQFTMDNIGVPLMTVTSRKSYDIEKLAQRLRIAIANYSTMQSPDLPGESSPVAVAASVSVESEAEAVPLSEARPGMFDTDPHLVIEKTRKLVSGLVSNISELHKSPR